MALRQQLAIYARTLPRPHLQDHDRRFWVWLSRWWAGWRSALVIVSPATVVRWHRQGFRYYWRWKCGNQPGRPRIAAEARSLIRQLSRENPTWGAPRIQAELSLLGHKLAQSTVAKYMVRHSKPSSPHWKTFLKNHVGSLASIDFCVVPTVTFHLLYVFVVLRHDRRRVVHFNVTAQPSGDWVARQLVQAFPYDEAPRYVIRDRDGIYGDGVRHCLENLGIEEVLIAPRSPWQNPFVEKLLGTLRRELLDHVIVLNERHLYRMLGQFFTYYHEYRSHQALAGNSPNPRAVQPPHLGKVISEAQVGGLHHRYFRAA
jgi:transposase InsO family protein